jgi:hypothetical protein
VHGEESLEYDYAPDDGLSGEVTRAAAACAVQAISTGGRPRTDEGDS